MLPHPQTAWISRLVKAGKGDQSPALEFGVAVIAVGVAILVRWLINPLLDHRLPFLTFFGAVAVAVWFGGWKPGLLAAALGFIAADLLFIETEPDAPLSLRGIGGVAGMVVYLVTCLMLIGLGSRMRSSSQDALAKTAELQRQITQREQAEHALHEADRRKDEFLATLAHELRNSLAPMSNALELMRLTSEPRTVEESRATIHRQLRQMVELVDDLLDVSRIKSGKVKLHKEPIELAKVVETAVEKAHPLMESSAHRLTVALPSDPLRLDADPNRLVQVFSNLLHNAAKYTDRGGRIELTAHRQNGEVVVSVRDNGIGIAAEHLPNVFDMFSQVGLAADRSQGGLGIGLSLVRRLVELHGGTVEAHSDGPAKGSEFVVRLPVCEH